MNENYTHTKQKEEFTKTRRKNTEKNPNRQRRIDETRDRRKVIPFVVLSSFSQRNFFFSHSFPLFRVSRSPPSSTPTPPLLFRLSSVGAGREETTSLTKDLCSLSRGTKAPREKSLKVGASGGEKERKRERKREKSKSSHERTASVSSSRFLPGEVARHFDLRPGTHTNTHAERKRPSAAKQTSKKASKREREKDETTGALFTE